MFVWGFFIFGLVRLFYEAGFLVFVLDKSKLGLLSKNSFKSANRVSMTKSATENNRNLTTKIVATSSENDIASAKVLGEKV